MDTCIHSCIFSKFPKFKWIWFKIPSILVLLFIIKYALNFHCLYKNNRNLDMRYKASHLFSLRQHKKENVVLQLVEALRYKPEGWWVQFVGIFHWHPSPTIWPWGQLILWQKWWVGLTTLPPACADCLQIGEPQTFGTLWACPGLYADWFSIYTENCKQQRYPVCSKI